MSIEEPKVIHVNDKDEVIGFLPKLEAHQKGLLHRAVSVFIFNQKGQWLLQRRAMIKYHSAGLWSNTCCSHPYPEESVEQAAIRRLQEEMNLICDLTKVLTFKYKAVLNQGLVEHEIDHVFIGFSDDLPQPNALEVSDYKYMSAELLETEIHRHPESFTAWFKLLYPEISKCLRDFKPSF